MRSEHLHTELMSKSNSKIIISRGIYWLILLVRSLEDLGSTLSVKQFSNLRTEVIRVTQRSSRVLNLEIVLEYTQLFYVIFRSRDFGNHHTIFLNLYGRCSPYNHTAPDMTHCHQKCVSKYSSNIKNTRRKATSFRKPCRLTSRKLDLEISFRTHF